MIKKIEKHECVGKYKNGKFIFICPECDYRAEIVDGKLHSTGASEDISHFGTYNLPTGVDKDALVHTLISESEKITYSLPRNNQREISRSSERETWRDFFMCPSNACGEGFMPNIVPAKELGHYLKLSELTIYKLAASGEIPGFKIGDSWRFDIQEIVKMISECRKEASRGGAPPGRMQNGGIRKRPGVRG